MEVAMMMMNSSQNQHMSPYKSHVGNPKRMMSMINPPFISRPAENLFPSNNNIHKGLLQTPNIFHSFPQYFSPPFHAPYGNSNGSTSYNNPALARGISCPPPINKKNNNNNNNNNNNSNNNRRSRDYSVTPKKAKKVASSNSPKKEEKLKNSSRVVVATKASSPTSSEGVVVISSTDSLGPDPKDLAKDVSEVVLSFSSTPQLSSSSSSSLLSSKSSSSVGNISVFSSSVKGIEGEQNHKMDIFSGSVMFAPSPPPSSLPLPTFSLRPKLSCNAEAAAGIDAGATDSLRRLLRLQ